MWHYLSCRQQFYSKFKIYPPTRLAFRELSACTFKFQNTHIKKAWHIFAFIGSLRSWTTWYSQLQRLMSTPKGGSFVALFCKYHFESVQVSKNPESSYLAFSYFKCVYQITLMLHRQIIYVAGTLLCLSSLGGDLH